MHLSFKQRVFVLTSLLLVLFSGVLSWCLFEQNRLLTKNFRLAQDKHVTPTTTPTLAQTKDNVLLTLPDDVLVKIKDSFVQAEHNGYRANVSFLGYSPKEKDWMKDFNQILLANTDKGVYGFAIYHDAQTVYDHAKFVKLDRDKLKSLNYVKPSNTLEELGVKLVSSIDMGVQDFYIYTPEKQVFLIKDFQYSASVFPGTSGYQVVYQGKETKDQDLINLGTTLEWQVLGMYPFQYHYETSSFLAYFPNKDILLIKVFGGDGCGGWGRVIAFNLTQKTQKDITKIGSGCDKHDRLIGVYQDKLVMGEATAKNQVDSELGLEKIYLLDPITLRKGVIVNNLSQYGSLWVDDRMSEKKFYAQLKEGHVYLLAISKDWDATARYLVNLKTKTVTKTIPPTPTPS